MQTSLSSSAASQRKASCVWGTYRFKKGNEIVRAQGSESRETYKTKCTISSFIVTNATVIDVCRTFSKVTCAFIVVVLFMFHLAVIHSPEGILSLSLSLVFFSYPVLWVVVLCIVIIAVISNNEKQCVFEGWGEEQTQRTTQEKRERTASCRASEKRKTRVIEYKERIR